MRGIELPVVELADRDLRKLLPPAFNVEQSTMKSSTVPPESPAL